MMKLVKCQTKLSQNLNLFLWKYLEMKLQYDNNMITPSFLIFDYSFLNLISCIKKTTFIHEYKPFLNFCVFLR